MDAEMATSAGSGSVCARGRWRTEGWSVLHDARSVYTLALAKASSNARLKWEASDNGPLPVSGIIRLGQRRGI